MTDSPSQERICVHCGTPRPVDEPECPSCGKPWVDERIDDGAAAASAAAGADSDAEGPASAGSEPGDSESPAPGDADEAAAAASGAPSDDATEELPSAAVAATAAAAAAGDQLSDTGEFTFDDWTLPPEAPRSRARWLIPIILLIAVVVVWVLVFLDDDSTTATTVAQEPVTTIAPTTTEATTTTSAPTTTSSTTTTTIDFPPPSAWEPVGEPIPAEELTLRQAAIGPLDFGDSITFVAGRLVASFGEAEAATVEGLCPPEESYALQWGELLAIFDGFRSDGVFVSYRYEDIGSDRQLGLTTLSGLALGDTVADLQSIYSQFDVTFETIEGRDHFRLLDGDELLLWGPVSGTEDDDVVEGIYSPSPCEDA